MNKVLLLVIIVLGTTVTSGCIDTGVGEGEFLTYTGEVAEVTLVGGGGLTYRNCIVVFGNGFYLTFSTPYGGIENSYPSLEDVDHVYAHTVLLKGEKVKVTYMHFDKYDLNYFDEIEKI